jgi:hypothetical protein
MPQRGRKFVLGLAVVAIVFLMFAATAELVPHHHNDAQSERVCPICHAPIMGLQPAAISASLQISLPWLLLSVESISVHAPFLSRESCRAPPEA